MARREHLSSEQGELEKSLIYDDGVGDMLLESIKSLEESREDLVKFIERLKAIGGETCEIFMDMNVRMLDETDKKIKKYKRLLRTHTHMDEIFNHKSKYNVEELKLIPIEDFYAFDKIRKTSKERSTACCPFHVEKKPSFVIYHDSNTYHCFGCQAHGDNINFVMKVNNMSFLEACEYLSKV